MSYTYNIISGCTSDLCLLNMLFTFSPQLTKVTYNAPDTLHTERMHTLAQGYCPEHPSVQIKIKRLFRRTKKRSCQSCTEHYEKQRQAYDELSATVDRLLADNLKLRETIVELHQSIKAIQKSGGQKAKMDEIQKRINSLLVEEANQTLKISENNTTLSMVVDRLKYYRSHIIAPNVSETRDTASNT